MTTRRIFLTLLFLSLPLTVRAGDNWPGWRGPRGDGISDETNVPARWSTTENVVWKTPIPGIGHSSPVIWGDRVFLTTCIEGPDKTGDRALLCLDRRSGQILWQKVAVTCPLEHIHKQNSFASSTPAT